MNTEQTVTTLKKIIFILNKHGIEYRILGSVAFAGMNGGLHRNIGDIDLIVDRSKKDELFEGLVKLGYKQAKGVFAFGRKYLALETLIHDRLLSVGYFVGTFEGNGNFKMGNHFVSVISEADSVKPTQYTLEGVPFIGIPPRAIAVRIMKSSNNPKRKKEVEFLDKNDIKPFASDGIHVRILGISFDFLYQGAMLFFNIFGVIRSKFGLPYDPWRSKIG